VALRDHAESRPTILPSRSILSSSDEDPGPLFCLTPAWHLKAVPIQKWVATSSGPHRVRIGLSPPDRDSSDPYQKNDDSRALVVAQDMWTVLVKKYSSGSFSATHSEPAVRRGVPEALLSRRISKPESDNIMPPSGRLLSGTAAEEQDRFLANTERFGTPGESQARMRSRKMIRMILFHEHSPCLELHDAHDCRHFLVGIARITVPAATNPIRPDVSEEVQPILDRHCFKCMRALNRKAAWICVRSRRCCAEGRMVRP